MQDALQQIDDFRLSLADQTYLSPSRVQTRLLDLWGELSHTPAAKLIEQWLSLTIERELFSGAELTEFLDELRAYLDLHANSNRVPQ